ncbi:MAG: hypothetical protein PHO62_07825 [Sulfurimonas sp.]|uniref:hypothetical protein n=1 Tax=Sulfurimonas sp. TaxID=2022749 RepID=UPI002606C79A|nr:hypothetical protein [Sulfurimonas sp.]MDD5373315.1 hypothetical protein [Sulfurimonas sp.]
MAREIVGQVDTFVFSETLKKLTGEYLNDRLRGLYIFLPHLAVCFSFLFLFFAVAGGGVMAEAAFLLSFLFLSFSGVFAYMMIAERASMASIGVINEARDTQLKYVFGLDNKPIKYYASIGSCVKDFLGKDIAEANKRNLALSNRTYEMLLDKKAYTMGYLLPGSTGSGKTVTLNTSVFLPAIMSGNGFFYIEGKGDRPITEAILGFIYQFGRESEVFILDFGAAATGGLTNGLSPLAVGNAKTVGELLKSLIDIMKGDNAWVSEMAIAFLEAMLLPLIMLRDMGLIIDSKNLKEIQCFADFDKFDKKQFNITALLNYLNFQSAIDLLYMMRRMFKDAEFVAKAKTFQEYSSLKKGFTENLIGRLERNLTSHNIDISAIVEPDYSKVDAETKRNHPKATEAWINALESFGSEKFYGNIFNKDESDFSILTAIQTGKMIITIIPSMSASSEQCGKMGKMMTAIGKSAVGYMLEQGSLVGEQKTKSKDKRYRPRKLPYAWVYDEPSNYANEDIPQKSSMVRSVGSDGGGMAIVWTGQSRTDADKIDDGKKIASEQLFANLGFTQCLNIQDQGWKDLMVKKVGERYVRREDEFEGGKNGDDEKITIRREKEPVYAENFFESGLRQQTGESIVCAKGFKNSEKLVAWYNEAPVCDMTINRNISSKKLLKTFKTTSEAEARIEALKKEIEAAVEYGIEAEFNKRDGLDKSFVQEVLDALKIIVTAAYPAAKDADNFTLELLSEDNPRVHGDYTPKTKNIRIYNAINKSREHLISTAVHELAHHVECVLTGTSGHAKGFYKIMHELLGVCMGLEDLGFDYNEAKNKKMLDSNDIRVMEKFFGSPTAIAVERAA